MSVSRSELAAALQIDPNRLLEQAVEQATVYFNVAADLAEHRAKLTNLENKKAVHEATLSDLIRKDPMAYSLEKSTEAAIKDLVSKDPQTISTEKQIVQAKLEVDLLQAGVTALDHRKRMIQEVVALHGQNFFAVPTLAEAGKEVLTKRAARKSMPVPANNGHHSPEFGE